MNIDFFTKSTVVVCHRMILGLIVAILALSVISVRIAYAEEYVDGDNEPVTQRNNMHTCPEGWFVVGVHVDNNDFLCSDNLGSYQIVEEFIDGDDEVPTQRNNMHACPVGSAVTGIHVNNNWLLCAPVSGVIHLETVDGDNEPPTQRNNMHACPPEHVLVGIHVTNNDFLCGQLVDLPPDVRENLVEVGRTNDACDGRNPVTLQSKDGEVSVNAGDKILVELPTMTREMDWYCIDRAHERVANGNAFNQVRISRAQNGAISWTFYRFDRERRVLDTSIDRCGSPVVWLWDAQQGGHVGIHKGNRNVIVELSNRSFRWYCGSSEDLGSEEWATGPTGTAAVRVSRASSGRRIDWQFLTRENNLMEVGRTNDACDARNAVAVYGQNGEVLILAGMTNTLIELPTIITEMSWYCIDRSQERVANNDAFNWVEISRAANGAISWIFYRIAVEVGDDKDDFVHNAPGSLRAAIGAFVAYEDPTILKNTLDSAWNTTRQQVGEIFVAEIDTDDRISSQSYNISAPDMAELRVRRHLVDDSVILKYIVHENKVTLDYAAPDPVPDPTFNVMFDIEIVLKLSVSTPSNLFHIENATLNLQHVQIDGSNLFSDLIESILAARIRAMETNLNAKSEDITQLLSEQFSRKTASLKEAIPEFLGYVETSVSSANGMLTLCFTSQPGQTCNLPTPIENERARQVLDVSEDNCSRPVIWVWDNEKGRFIGIRKGDQDIEVELDGRRFAWYCGWQNDKGDQEWATGPMGTHAVRISRASEGREIDWQFLYWR